MNNLNTYQTHRFWLRFLFVAIAYIVPFTVLAFRFNFFEFREAEVKFSGLVILVGVLLLFQFRAEVYTWIESWEFSLLKIFLLGLGKVWAFLLALGIIALARFGIDNIEFIIGWISVPQIIAYLTIKPFSERADHMVKRELRKQEVKEALQESNVGIPLGKRKTK